ncbi:MAG: ABC transporter substrate-binding protein [Paracoccaceae bacterium]
MNKLHIALLASASALMLGVTGVQAGDDVSHNWNAENEVDAMRIFREQYESLGGVWAETTFPDTEQSIASVKTRIIGGQPPMALQSTLGGTSQDFANNGLLADLSAVADAEDWDARLPAGLAAIAKYEGNYVSAPVFVDVINWMYTNNDVLEAAGIEAPNSFEEFMASLPVLKAAGKTPIAIGGDAWQIAILFDHVILASGGDALYDGVMSADADVVASSEVLNAFEMMGELRGYTDEGSAGRGWNDTVSLLIAGDGAYFFMGPWAAGAFSDMGDEGGQWSCRLTPWDSSITAVADGFQFIAGGSEEDMAAQALFASAVMDPETQIAAARAKGTLPAVIGASADDFEGCPAKAVAAMQTGNTVTHWNGRASDIGAAVKDTLTAFWSSDMSAEDAHAMLISMMPN